MHGHGGDLHVYVILNVDENAGLEGGRCRRGLVAENGRVPPGSSKRGQVHGTMILVLIIGGVSEHYVGVVAEHSSFDLSDELRFVLREASVGKVEDLQICDAEEGSSLQGLTRAGRAITPLSPLVMTRARTSCPESANLAIVPPQPSSRSSG